MSRHIPTHVTMRVRPGVCNLRSKRAFGVIREAFVRGRDRGTFRLVHFTVQGNHLHLICEAHEAARLSRGVQGLAIRIARGLNKLMGRRGRNVFADRFHSRVLETPRQVHHTLAYLFNNARRHGCRRRREIPRMLGFEPIPLGIDISQLRE